MSEDNDNKPRPMFGQLADAKERIDAHDDYLLVVMDRLDALEERVSRMFDEHNEMRKEMLTSRSADAIRRQLARIHTLLMRAGIGAVPMEEV